MQPQQQTLAIPAAIVIAGALVAAAVYFGGGGAAPAANEPETGLVKDVPKVTATDHIVGNLNAKVFVVQYTDLECPYCKQFDSTMKKVMQKYGQSGQVAWVMRDFPLQELHPNAPALALASECVASLGGNDAFWRFKDSVLEQAPITEEGGKIVDADFFDMTKLDSTVTALGIDGAGFRECYDGKQPQDGITKEFNDAVASGGRGTPFNILIGKNGQQTEIRGSQPYESVVASIEAALR